jgi:HTH-type transcriptional regulator / antitoxin HigA
MGITIKPIRSENDYDEALDIIDSLFDAQEGSEEADLRDVLVTLVEKYEEEVYPIDFPDPISAIKYRMDQQNLTQKDLIPLIGNRSKVSEILSGKRDLSLKMIRALNEHLNIPAEILLQNKEINSLEEDSEVDYDLFPISEMKKYGAFEGINIDKIIDNAEELIKILRIRIGFGFAVPEFKFRISKSTRLNAKINPYAVQGWILHLLHDSSKIDQNVKFDGDVIDDNFLKTLVGLSILNEGPRIAQEYLYKHGILLNIIHHYKSTYLDGAAYITSEGLPIIGLTLRYDRIDNFWFNLLHELGHIKLHLSKGNYIADDMSLRGSQQDDEIERQADEFAENALLPAEFSLDELDSVPQKDLISFSVKNNIHPAIVAGKIQFTKNNYRLFSNLVGRGEVRKLFY